ncbi:hypothetical protein NADFUDRAFT_40341 [Nadsonia fulvescens var. elongata DSM 6958]|uniref:Uncharacterized protein n=1 Tax=Nadsonia fulvescens var. elongata DSM 6958 TaxID=857566 RepID=A0A1E3PQP5_9ASCO|nr:hypothetical protein NADFUDRAFT_40341 [Nadsonia fulvescens var. elongata DSM 6958]
MARLSQAPTPKPLRRLDVYSASETQDSDFDGLNDYDDILQLENEINEPLESSVVQEVPVRSSDTLILPSNDTQSQDHALSAPSKSPRKLASARAENIKEKHISPWVDSDTLENPKSIISLVKGETTLETPRQRVAKIQDETESLGEGEVYDLNDPESERNNITEISNLSLRLVEPDTPNRSGTIFSEVSLVIDRFNEEVSRLDSPSQYQNYSENNDNGSTSSYDDKNKQGQYVFTGEVAPIEPLIIEIVDSDAHSSDVDIKSDPENPGDPFGFSTVRQLRPKIFTSPTRKRFTPMEMLSKVIGQSSYDANNQHAGFISATPQSPPYLFREYMPHRLSSITPDSVASQNPRRSSSFVVISPSRRDTLGYQFPSKAISVEASPISRALSTLPQRASPKVSKPRLVNKGKQKAWDSDHADDINSDGSPQESSRSRQLSINSEVALDRSNDEYGRQISQSGIQHGHKRRRQNYKSAFSRRKRRPSHQRSGSEISDAGEGEISSIKLQLDNEFRLKHLPNLKRSQQEIDNWVLEVEAVSEG